MSALQRSADILRIEDYLPSPAARPPRVARRPVDALRREQLFLQVILCDGEPDLVGRTWSCRTIRFDADHIEFLGDRVLPEGTLVDLWLDVAAGPGKFFLSGRVRWSHPRDGAATLVGIELEDGAATDYAAWRALHA